MKLSSLRGSIGLALLLVTANAAGAQPSGVLDTRLEAASGRFAGVLGVQARGERSANWSVSGLAGDTVRHGADVAYPVASVTKSVVAVAVLRLVEQERLQLNDRLDMHYPPAAGRPAGAVTIAQLLTHQSGIPSVLQANQGLDGSLDEAQWPKPTTPSEVLAEVLPMPLRFVPGSRYSYNNSGYILLGEVIARVTGKPYATAVMELALAPAGVQEQACFCDDLPGHEDAEGRELKSDGSVTPAIRMHPTRSGAAGALRITPRALLAWGRALVDGRILQPTTLAQMWSPGKPTRRSGETMGMGWLVRVEDHGRLALHDGTIPGIASALAIDPDSGTVAVGVLSPTLPMDRISRSETYVRERTAQLAIGKRLDTIPRLGTPLANLSGEYALPDKKTLQISRVQQGWKLTVPGASPLALAQSVRLNDASSQQALKAVRAWAAGGQAALKPYLSTKMRDALPDGALDGAWAEWQSRLGPHAGAHSYALSKDKRSVRVRLRFERGNVDIALNRGPSGEIEGLQLLGESSAVLPETIVAQVTEGGELWIDGYRHDVDPVTLHPRIEAGKAVGMWIGHAGLPDAFLPRTDTGSR